MKTCGFCEAQFYVPRYRMISAKYCSRRCSAFAGRQQITHNCDHCGTTFTHISSRANTAKYCSRACYYQAQHIKGTVQYTCRHCGTVFRDSPSKKRIYCSRDCINKTKKENWKATFATVRKNMVRRNMLKKCARCGYDEHPHILGIHHRDRNRNNNELSNLEVLCANCHSLEHSAHTPF